MIIEVIAKAIENEFDVAQENIKDDMVRELREVAMGHADSSPLLQELLNLDAIRAQEFIGRLRKVYRINKTDAHAQMARLGRIGFTLEEQVGFVSQALRNEDVTVFGDGSQTRSVCYVSDLIEGIYRLMMSEYIMPMNIGNPEELSMLQLAKEIIELTGSKSKIIFKKLPVDDPKIRQPDITKAIGILKWEPKVNRAVGLKKTIEYFRAKI